MRRVAIVMMLVAAVGGVPAGQAVAEEADHVVQVGAADPDNPSAPYSIVRFYPSVLEVHRGDLVEWRFAGDLVIAFHSVAFLPGGRDDERGYLVRPDEAPGTYATDERWFVGSDCGLEPAAPCTIDSTETFYSSGTPVWNNGLDGPLPFRATIDLPPGAYPYFCTVHPTMRGDVLVVPDGDPLYNPAAAEVEAEVEADAAAARVLQASAETEVVQLDIVDGQRVWTVRAGVGTVDGHTVILRFFPSQLQVGAGDRVRWIIPPEAKAEPHSITFGGPTAWSALGAPALGFYPACDPDDRAGGLPHVPGPFAITPVPCPANLELGVAPWLAEQHRAPMDAVVSEFTYHDSGIVVPEDAPDWTAEIGRGSGDRFPSTFEAVFPSEGTFGYACTIHEGVMPASVTVVPV